MVEQIKKRYKNVHMQLPTYAISKYEQMLSISTASYSIMYTP